MAPRSVADATRFTPTGPHAFTSPPASSTPTESPQQRVARLRDAARKAKAERQAGTLLDRVVDRGRVWADRAHRATAIGLIGATVLCGAITIYAFTDMIIYNRRRKKAEHSARLEQAQKQVEAPTTTPVAVSSSDPVTVTAAVAAAAAATAGAGNDNGNGNGNGTGSGTASGSAKGGPWTQLKSWAMSGMTPADVEYKTAFERERAAVEAAGKEEELSLVAGAAGAAMAARSDGDGVVGNAPRKEGGVLARVSGWWGGSGR